MAFLATNPILSFFFRFNFCFKEVQRHKVAQHKGLPVEAANLFIYRTSTLKNIYFRSLSVFKTGVA
ncbi:MAG: hypothetical protein LBF89_08745 [Bacteroidales bacterium]|jgi:hypothetical protein|nr:hypothetical protein [Bacteroidales bacterium]